MAAEAVQDEFAPWRLGLELLRAGHWKEGWPLYESRPVEMGGRDAGKPILPFPEWQGEPVESLLVLPEQGFGDQIMFGRWALELQGRGAAVFLMCHPRLARLFSGLGVPVISSLGRVALPKVDAWALSPSLPYRCGATVETIPPPMPLRGTGAARGGIGLAWRTKPEPAGRALPEQLARDLMGELGAISLEPEDTGATEFQDTADLIAGLDVVIAVDSAVAHLAGSMGKPTLTLLPSPSDWRWLDDVGRSRFYPSMSLFRQVERGRWDEPVEAAKQAARALVAGGTGAGLAVERA